MATIEDFTVFLHKQVGIPEESLPDDSPWIVMGYQGALEIIPCELSALPFWYNWAIYCAGASWILYEAIDPEGTGDWFIKYREKNGMGRPILQGMLQATADVSTSQSYFIPQSMSNLDAWGIQWLNNPWGAKALAVLQRFGHIWGRN